nr:cytochrome c [Myxococcota bacterium]
TLDYGHVRIGFYESRGGDIDPRSRARWESWGPGRADVIEDVADTPIAIPDLWGLRHQRLLTQAGTLRHESPLALAIRQETQYVQANHHRTRPPRELMWALSLYLYSLEPPPARAFEGAPRDRERGAAIFANACGRCHSSAIGSGELVDAAEVGTDPELALGDARGTGGYRPAPLLRVADAAPYLHHGVIPSLDALLDPAREEHGHRFGMDLSADERTQVIAYLRSR